MDRLTSYQISEWEVVDRLDPVGKWRDEFNFARLESLITNIAITFSAKKGTKPKETTPIEFMPDWADEFKQLVKQQSIEDMKEIFKQIASASVKRKQTEDRSKIPPMQFQNRKKEKK